MSENSSNTGIAVIGMECRFPKASDVSAFWRNLIDGVEGFEEVSADRRLRITEGLSAASREKYVPWFAEMEGVELFDAGLFGFTPREAEITDPQHRISMELAWAALERTGYNRVSPGIRVALYASSGMNNYLFSNLLRSKLISGPSAGTRAMDLFYRNDKDFLSTRISYHLGLCGPSINIGTACSSSLVGIHLASQSLLVGECDVAMVVGCSVMCPPRVGYFHQEGMIFSKDGRCRPFDSDASGTIFGSGAAVVVLRRLEDAIQSRDHIYAVVRGTAVTNDGSRKVGFTAPSIGGQVDAISEALGVANCSPDEIGMIEAHGTGTLLGDAIEMVAFKKAFKDRRTALPPCVLGSAKANVGHLDAAAGLAGFIRAVLSVYHGMHPAHPNFRSPNPQLGLAESCFVINTRTEPWNVPARERRAGVNSFGIGGTNAHVVVEGYEASVEVPVSEKHILMFQGRSPEAARAIASGVRELIANDPDLRLCDVAFSLRNGRKEFPFRTYAVVADPKGFDGAFEEAFSRITDMNAARSNCVFYIPHAPLGSQDRALAHSRKSRVFKGSLQDVEKTVISKLRSGDHLRWLGDELCLLDTGRIAESSSVLGHFIVGYALARYAMGLGIAPELLVGRGVGAIVAAVLAEILPIEAAVLLAVGSSDGGRLPGELATAISGLLAKDNRTKPNIPLDIMEKSGFPESAQEWMQILVEAPRRVVRPDKIFAGQIILKLGFPSVGTGDDRTPFEAADCRVLTFPCGAEDEAAEAIAMAEIWMRGGNPDWDRLGEETGRRVALPVHPFERSRYWVEPDNQPSGDAPPACARAEAVDTESGREIFSVLLDAFSQLTGLDASTVPITSNFFEMGLDSLTIIQIGELISERFGITYSLQFLYEECPSFEFLISDIQSRRSKRRLPDGGSISKGERTDSVSAAVGQGASPDDTMQQLLARQLTLMEQQMRILENLGIPNTAPTVSVPSKNEVLGPFRPANLKPVAVNEEQNREISELIAEFTAKTRKSKRNAVESRRVHADVRNSVNFRSGWKAAIFPLTFVRADGAFMEDIDGNRYIDLGCGSGALLFGHNPEFLNENIRAQLDKGSLLFSGRVQAVDDVARMITDVCGCERVYFCNTGSEAVMTALRLARSRTRREKVVIFRGSYHGNFDSVLMRGTLSRGIAKSYAATLGIAQKVADDVIVLEYGAQESLDYIRLHGESFAAILVEPIQSRRPAFQPVGFLKELRRVSESLRIALIFDEVITGFRVSPDGCQGRFGVKADMVTYGKILGGGMPIGVVAGKGEYLDAIDGGYWGEGAADHPTIPQVFTAGTFSQHAFAISNAKAVLTEITNNPELYTKLDRLTDRLVSTLNTEFKKYGSPLSVENCGSLMYFDFDSRFEFSDLLNYYLLLDGVRINWKLPNFLSAAHADADVERVCQTFSSALAKMHAAHLLPGDEATDGADRRCGGIESDRLPSGSAGGRLPLTEAQRAIGNTIKVNGGDSTLFNQVFEMKIPSAGLIPGLEHVLRRLAERHEALCVAIDPEFEWQEVRLHNGIPTSLADLSGLPNALRAEAFRKVTFELWRHRLDLAAGEVARVVMVNMGSEISVLLLVHHIICDAQGFNTISREIDVMLHVPFGTAEMAVPPKFSEFLRRGNAPENEARSIDFWSRRLQPLPEYLNFPFDYIPPAVRKSEGELLERDMNACAEALGEFCEKFKCTRFVALLSAFAVFLERITGVSDLVVGVPFSGRIAPFETIVAQAVNLLPLRIEVNNSETFASLVQRVGKLVREAYEHRHCSYTTLVGRLQMPGDRSRTPLLSTTFNVDKGYDEGTTGDVSRTGAGLGGPIQFDLELNILDGGKRLAAGMNFNVSLFQRDTAASWLAAYCDLAPVLMRRADAPISDSFSMDDQTCRGDDVQCEDSRLVDVFNGVVEGNRDHVALVCGDRHVTFGMLRAQAFQLAGMLGEAGIRCEEIVAIDVEDSISRIVAVLGTVFSGGAYLCLPKGKGVDIPNSLPDLGAVGLAIIDEMANSGAGLKVQLIRPREKTRAISFEPSSSSLSCLAADREEGSLYLLEVTHGMILNRLSMAKEDTSSPGVEVEVPRVLMQRFGEAVLPVWDALLSGKRIHIREEEANTANVSGINDCTTWDDPVPISEFGWPYCTDQPRAAAIRSLCPDISSDLRGRLVILSEKNIPLPAGRRGWAALLDHMGPRGVWRDPAKTAVRFIPGAKAGGRIFLSPDIVVRLSSGRIKWLGRKEDRVVIRGFVVNTSEVESVISKLLAGPIAVREIDGSLWAFFESPKDAVAIGEKLKERLSQLLPRYMAPEYYLQLERMPRTFEGYVDHEALRAFASSRDRNGDAMKDCSMAEQKLVSIWKKILKLPRLDINGDFFSLGGNSILLLTIRGEIAREFGINLPVRDLYLYSSIKSLAVHLARQKAELELRINAPLSARVANVRSKIRGRHQVPSRAASSHSPTISKKSGGDSNEG